MLTAIIMIEAPALLAAVALLEDGGEASEAAADRLACGAPRSQPTMTGQTAAVPELEGMGRRTRWSHR